MITDKKIGVSLDDSIVDHYRAEVLSQNDYYPFGMEEPGRGTGATTGATAYPYAFNGKRMENIELYTSNIYDYGMRMYDARVGRFFSVDPLTGKYPELSPYQFGSNTPIQATDIDGLEADFSKAKINKLKYTRGSVWNPISNAKKVGIFIDNSVISAYNSVIDASEFSYNYIFYHKQTSETVQENLMAAIFKGLIYLGSTTSKQRSRDIKNYVGRKLSDVNTYEDSVGQLMLAGSVGIAEERFPNWGLGNSVENVATQRLQLFSELDRLGVKYNPTDVLGIGKNPSGEIIFLEKGNGKAGLEHILKHANDFANIGIPKSDIGNVVFKAAIEGNQVGLQGTRPIYQVTYNGDVKNIAITIGKNGFIVGANPTTKIP